jgi:ribonuclease HI
VVDAIEKHWLLKWRKKGYAKTKNTDLWRRLYDLLQIHKVRFVWVKGHAGIPENERCDVLAVKAAALPNLPKDIGYETAIAENSFPLK